MRMERIAFLGNSITMHGPKPDIGWDGNWGMAASALEKDYVHTVLGHVAGATGRRPEALIENIACFEREHATFDIAPLVRRCREFKPDIVVLAIGENVPALDSEEKKARYKVALAALVDGLTAESKPALFARSAFWPEPVRDGILAEVCREAGGVFVDIAALGRIEAHYARSERKFQHDGVAAHPGDKGMEAIAAAIWAAMADTPGRTGNSGGPRAGVENLPLGGVLAPERTARPLSGASGS